MHKMAKYILYDKLDFTVKLLRFSILIVFVISFDYQIDLDLFDFHRLIDYLCNARILHRLS